MASFYEDNDDLRFYLERAVDWGPLVRLTEHDRRAEGSPASVEEAVGTYKELLELVGTFRHPLAVAASLERRDGLALEVGLRLWQAYNERLVAAHDAAPFPLISFDLPPDAYAAGVARIAEALALPERPGFFTEELRHHGPVDDADLPPELAALHDRLRELAGDLA